MKYRSYNKTEKNKCKDYSKSAMRFVRGFTAVILIVIQIFLNVFLLNPCGVSAATDSQESIASDTISSGERNDDTESYVLYDSTTKEFELNGTVLSALVCVYEKGIEFKSIKNTITEHEWIDGTSATELVEIYYDNKSVKHNFDWKYYGCFLYEDDTKLTFEFRSANGKFTCLQECFINRLDADGDVLSVSNTIISNDTTEISLPERFSSVSVQMTAREDYYMQYLNQTVCDAKVSAEDVIRFSIGNDDNFDMSIPLCYYSAKGVHGVAFGTGVFSPEHSSVVDVAVSDECMIASAKSAYKVFYGEKDITYAFPTFFCCVFDGNNNIGKNLIKSWSAAEKIDAYGSLPLTYENIVGVFDPENIESVRTAFYNMQFFFSASDVRNNMYSNIKNDLEACLSDDVNAYNYIFRSAMFSDFDYSKAGLVDGTVLKDCAAENDELENQCKLFQMDIVTLTNLNDSIMNKMYDQAKQLKIKDKHIENLQYRLDHTEKVVEVHTRDTIFVSPDFVLDTCLMDKWSNICLHLEYPNKVEVNAKFDNEQYVIVHWKKVPVKPRKCKFAEWFTRKRKEITVDVISESPYVTTKKQRFVEIVK